MYIFKKGDPDYHDPMNDNFAELASGKVSLAGNETVLGIKNFKDGLQSKGYNVLTQNGVLTATHGADDIIQSGSVEFERYGDWITCFLNFQVRSADLLKGQRLVKDIAPEFLPIKNRFFSISGGPQTAIIKFDGNYLKPHSTLLANGWYFGTITYLAKNRL